MIEASLVPKSPAPTLVRQARQKPLLRGIPDVLAAVCALPAVAMLVLHASAGTHKLVATIYGACLVMLFATSATYHTFMWPPATRMLLRRFDHSMVYVLIAGTYTPISLVALPGGQAGPWLLAAVWSVTALGMLKSFLWEHAPRSLNTIIYISMGWLVAFLLPSLVAHQGYAGAGLILLGGILYTLGAVIYARRWPNPDPSTFGYHEVFHVFVIGAAVSHFVALWWLLA